MYAGLDMGNEILKGENIEQITNQILELFTQYRLSYNSSNHILDVVQTKLGEKSYIKA